MGIEISKITYTALSNSIMLTFLLFYNTGVSNSFSIMGQMRSVRLVSGLLWTHGLALCTRASTQHWSSPELASEAGMEFAMLAAPPWTSPVHWLQCGASVRAWSTSASKPACKASSVGCYRQHVYLIVQPQFRAYAAHATWSQCSTHARMPLSTGSGT